jgi:hypothetical protein
MHDPLAAQQAAGLLRLDRGQLVADSTRVRPAVGAAS